MDVCVAVSYPEAPYQQCANASDACENAFSENRSAQGSNTCAPHSPHDCLPHQVGCARGDTPQELSAAL